MPLNFNCVFVNIKNLLNSPFILVYGICFLAILIHACIIKNGNYFVVTFLIFIIITFTFSLIGYQYKMYLFKEQNCFSKIITPNGIYVAILISDSLSDVVINSKVSRFLKNKIVDASIGPLYFLQKSFERRGIDYKIIRGASEKNLDELILDTNCNELYIVGHGSRGSFAVSNKKVYYSKYQSNNHKKQIISQLHCNNYKCVDNENISLTKMLAKDVKNSYLSKGYCTYIEITYYCFKQWYKSKKKKL